MTGFWITTGLLSLAVAAVLAVALLRGRRDTGPAEAFDVQVYRDQLKEVDRDLERGVLSAEDGDRIRTEVSRRLLSADAKAQADARDADQPRTLGLAVAGGMALVVLGGTYGLYTQLGAPGYGDLALATRIEAAADARANRPSQAEAEAQVPATAPVNPDPSYANLVEQLRGAVAERPGDVQGLTLLARSEAALGNFAAAWAAQDRLVAVLGETATGQQFADLADLMVLAAGGYVSPEAERALEEALQRDPTNGTARYYAGLMLAQTGRPDAAFNAWQQLLVESPSDAPWIPPIRAQIEDLAWRAGQFNFVLPEEPGQRGPTAADIEAAGDMSEEDQRAMIQGMVAGLADRLATSGGTAEDWARLITAYGVLGEQANAVAIWTEAQQVFAGNDAALTVVREGARRAGLVIQ